ncbi:MAG TPA: hypothetical protein VFP30_01700 [Candidatus Limnocylindria bacterium]|nr:hypothetical protein [Candidatus Limnocylindria bacterium]
MELAALASFAVLLIGWIVAPDRPRPMRAVQPQTVEPEVEAQPAAA